MNLKSIRWRLPLSYAAIALLTALILGGALIGTQKAYYTQKERSYLQGNAGQIGPVLAQLLKANLPADILKDQIANWSFLLQARLGVRDLNGRVLADSGIPDNHQVMMVVNMREDGFGNSASVRAPSPSSNSSGGLQVERGSPIILPSSGVFILPQGEVINTTGQVLTTNCTQENPLPNADPKIACAPDVFVNQAGAAGGEQVVQGSTAAGATFTQTLAGPVGIAMSMSPSLYGFSLEGTSVIPARRSHQVVIQPLRDETGALLGSLLLSDGPAYEDEIIRSIARGWLVAGLAAVLLAGGAGWLIGRKMTAPLVALTGAAARMAQGDLAARAAVVSKDEYGELGSTFNSMAARVEEIVTTLRNFVADAAHELNTPLTALNTNLELAADEAGAEGRKRFISSARAQIARLEGIIGGLLDLSRLEAGQPVFSVLDLNQVVDGLAEAYASRAEQAELQFKLERQSAALRVRGNADQLQHALGNLLDNALKFTPAGGTILVSLAETTGEAALAVTNSGGGIPEEDIPHLFQRFHRGRNSAGHPGSGLGLAIVKAVATAHGGQVLAENTAAGARFTIRLPRLPE
jgi:signal transduction histidine kinase